MGYPMDKSQSPGDYAYSQLHLFHFKFVHGCVSFFFKINFSLSVS